MQAKICLHFPRARASPSHHTSHVPPACCVGWYMVWPVERLAQMTDGRERKAETRQNREERDVCL